MGRPTKTTLDPGGSDCNFAAEKALTAVIQDAYVPGISTRAVDDLGKAMAGTGIAKSQVSQLCEEIDRLRSRLPG